MFNYETEEAIQLTDYTNYDSETTNNICSCCLQYDQCSGNIDYGWCDKEEILTRWDAKACKSYRKL